ncbi:MAG: hypothetical protein IJT34_10985 [Butyrivibrio sp.]|nr:hypothetical protein [Butyrivibrio sp.]
MKFPVFTSFILFVLFTQFILRRSNRREQEADATFWDREREANAARKKPLDDLPFLHIPLEELPFGVLPEDPDIMTQEKTIRSLAATEDEEWSRIVNLTGISNTELKLRYGAANLERLIYYDQNYTSLVTALQAWGAALSEHGLYHEAETVWSYAISIGTDISGTYAGLIQLWRDHLFLPEETARERIAALRPTAESLQSLSRERILQLIDTSSTTTE